MRVLCINEEWRDDKKKYRHETPVFGGEYTVVNCRYCKKEQYIDMKEREIIRHPAGVYYRLSGFKGFEYHAGNFATLPDQTAEEMSEENRESIANLEHV